MENDYKSEIEKAAQRTKDWGLVSRNSSVMADQALLDASRPPLSEQEWTYRWFENWSRACPIPPLFRANACAPLHLTLAAQLMMIDFPAVPVITIGDVAWLGDPCFHVTEESLRGYLDAGPEAEDNIHVHVWLTFPVLRPAPDVRRVTVPSHVPWRSSRFGLRSMPPDSCDGGPCGQCVATP
jgi:hypothetical protein